MAKIFRATTLLLISFLFSFQALASVDTPGSSPTRDPALSTWDLIHHPLRYSNSKVTVYGYLSYWNMNLYPEWDITGPKQWGHFVFVWNLTSRTSNYTLALRLRDTDCENAFVSITGIYAWAPFNPPQTRPGAWLLRDVSSIYAETEHKLCWSQDMEKPIWTRWVVGSYVRHNITQLPIGPVWENFGGGAND